MKKIIKNVLPALGLIAFLSLTLTPEVKSEEPSDCETVVVSGRKMNVNPGDEWNYECMGALTDCSDVWIVCDPE